MLTAESYFRLIIDPPQDAAWNMAVDEALLDEAAARGVATLRFYQWSEPTLSLGYFQRAADRRRHAASRDAACVRRMSGGGAILHDRELTYSLALPASHPLARHPTSLYGLVHRMLIDALATFGVLLRRHGESPEAMGGTYPVREIDAAITADDQPFLCFASRSADDLVLAAAPSSALPAKIVGSAQRRRRGAVLQHGSVLLGRSKAAPELPGIMDFGGLAVDRQALIQACVAGLGERLAVDWQPAPIDGQLAAAAAALRDKKYTALTWTERR